MELSIGKPKTKNNFLTTREIEYLSLVALGCSNKNIAKHLFVSYNTVKKTLENIFLKLGAKDRANAVTICFIHQLITPQSLTKKFEYYKSYLNHN